MFNGYIDDEVMHRLGLMTLRLAGCEPARSVLHAMMRTDGMKTKAMGIEFDNPVGLAAGYDKNGEAVRGIEAMGFGHADIGTVVPKPQPGSPRPRMFRLRKDKALINRMGFNSEGSERVFWNLAPTRKPRRMPVFVNVGKNKDTPIEEAAIDYLEAIRMTHPRGRAYTCNVSSPNTTALRDLQQRARLDELLRLVQDEVRLLAPTPAEKKPVIVKLAPDMDWHGIDDALMVCQDRGVEGICIGNTTFRRDGLVSTAFVGETGGASGPILYDRMCEIVAYVRKHLPHICVIAAGGIDSGSKAWRVREYCGADLVQILTAIAFHGFGIARQVNVGLRINQAARLAAQ